MNIMVTGGAGCIGSKIAEAYVAEGYRVFVIDNLSTGKAGRLPKEVEFEELDIRSPSVEHLLRKAKIDIVNHHAANVSVRKSVKEPINDAKINITGTLNLLQACERASVSRIIFASSSSVYGIQESFPVSEMHDTLPISPHGVAKLTCEHYMYCYKKIGRVNYLSLRYGDVYGPGQSIFGEGGFVATMLNNFVRAKVKNMKAKVFVNGDGEQARDLVFIDDVIHANVLAIRHGGGIINVGTGNETTINTLIDTISKITLCDPEIVNMPFNRGEPRRMVLNAKRARLSLGWTPKIYLKNGIEMYYQHLMEDNNGKTPGNGDNTNISETSSTEESN